MSFEPTNTLGFDAPHILGFAVTKQIELEDLALRRTAEEAHKKEAHKKAAEEEAHKKAAEAEEARRKAEAKKAAVTAAESARLKAAEEARLKTAQAAQRRASVQASCAPPPKSVTPPQGGTDAQELNRQSLLPPSLPPTSMPVRLPEKAVEMDKAVEMALKLGLDFSKAGQPASPQVA